MTGSQTEDGGGPHRGADDSLCPHGVQLEVRHDEQHGAGHHANVVAHQEAADGGRKSQKVYETWRHFFVVGNLTDLNVRIVNALISKAFIRYRRHQCRKRQPASRDFDLGHFLN